MLVGVSTITSLCNSLNGLNTELRGCKWMKSEFFRINRKKQMSNLWIESIRSLSCEDRVGQLLNRFFCQVLIGRIFVLIVKS